MLILQAIDLLKYTKFFLFLFQWNALKQLTVWYKMRDQTRIWADETWYLMNKFLSGFPEPFVSNNLIKPIPEQANLNESVACVFKTVCSLKPASERIYLEANWSSIGFTFPIQLRKTEVHKCLFVAKNKSELLTKTEWM